MTGLPLGTDGPDLVAEPVIGWRTWRVVRDERERVRLVSPMQALVWPPREPARATCGRSALAAHTAPAAACTCGIYAAESMDRLRRVGLQLGGLAAGAVGTVAMWGTVVVHQVGFRCELAYPGRLRLVCARCVAEGRSGEPSRVKRQGDLLVPTCQEHASSISGRPVRDTPARLQAELLSEYAVDLLPVEALQVSRIRALVPRPLRTLAEQARREARVFVRLRETWIAAIVMTLLLLRMGGGSGEPFPAPAPVATTGAVRPLAGTGDPVRVPLAEPSAGASFPELAIVCGRLEGVVVTRARCGARGAGVVGFAWHPAEPRGACETHGYTRKGRYSVCWLDPSVAEMPTRPPRWRLPGVPFEELFRGGTS